MIFAHFRPREEKNSLKKYYSLDRTETNDFVIRAHRTLFWLSWGQVIFWLFPRLVDIYTEPLLNIFPDVLLLVNVLVVKWVLFSKLTTLRFALYENQDLKWRQVNRDYLSLTINGRSFCPIITVYSGYFLTLDSGAEKALSIVF